jgi:hypothetical protein
MSSETIRLKDLIGRLIDTKQDRQLYIGGLLGTYVNGVATVRVANQPGYVYVRLNGSLSEVITAVNGVVAEVFDLKVIVTIPPENPGVYTIKGRDLNQYGGFGTNNGQGASAYLPHHGDTHSFGIGVDPVFVYKRQMMQPLGIHPTAPISNHLYVEPDFYIWQNQVKYFYGANTVDLTAAKPTNGQNGRYLTVYLNGATNTLAYLTGSDFIIWPFAATGTLNTIIAPLASIGIPLGAIILTSGSATFDWPVLKDIRSFLDGGGTSSLMHPLDPAGGYHTGTLPGQYVIINDPGHFYTGTVTVDQALQEIGGKFGLFTGTYQVLGTGTAGRLAEWTNINTIRATTIIKSGAGIITFSAPTDLTFTLDGSIEFNLTGALVNQPPLFDGSKWVPGKIALSAPSPVTFTLDSSTEIDGAGATNGQALVYNASLGKYAPGDVASSGGAGSGHDHGVTRINAVSGTINIPLLDFAAVIEYASFNGFILDGVSYSISSGSDYLVLDTALNTNGVFQTAYQVLNI